MIILPPFVIVLSSPLLPILQLISPTSKYVAYLCLLFLFHSLSFYSILLIPGLFFYFLVAYTYHPHYIYISPPLYIKHPHYIYIYHPHYIYATPIIYIYIYATPILYIPPTLYIYTTPIIYIPPPLYIYHPNS